MLCANLQVQEISSLERSPSLSFCLCVSHLLLAPPPTPPHPHTPLTLHNCNQNHRLYFPIHLLCFSFVCCRTECVSFCSSFPLTFFYPLVSFSLLYQQRKLMTQNLFHTLTIYYICYMIQLYA